MLDMVELRVGLVMHGTVRYCKSIVKFCEVLFSLVKV